MAGGRWKHHYLNPETSEILEKPRWATRDEAMEVSANLLALTGRLYQVTICKKCGDGFHLRLLRREAQDRNKMIEPENEA